MIAKDGIHNLKSNLSPERERVIQRIMNLSDEQFELLLTLCSQQEIEFSPTCQTRHLTSA